MREVGTPACGYYLPHVSTHFKWWGTSQFSSTSTCLYCLVYAMHQQRCMISAFSPIIKDILCPCREHHGGIPWWFLSPWTTFGLCLADMDRVRENPKGSTLSQIGRSVSWEGPHHTTSWLDSSYQDHVQR